MDDIKGDVRSVFITFYKEDGQIFCSDAEGKLLDDMALVLNGFLVDSIIYIGFQENSITISFHDGYIRIYY